MNARVIPLEALYERDIDLLLLEELSVSADFASWLVEQVFSDVKFHSFSSGQHSVIQRGRESDIVFEFIDNNGDHYAVLIEDKIDAIAQPGQPQAYRERANLGKIKGDWKDAKTCIVAPSSYLQTDSSAPKYDEAVSFESIALWFETHLDSDPRHRYRANVMRAAIEQARRRRIAERDDNITSFWKSYWRDASSFYPELDMHEPGEKTAGSTWIQFTPKNLNKTRTIDHKLTAGFVDLSLFQVSASRLTELQARFFPTLAGHPMQLTVIGKSLGIRAEVPKIDPRQNFAEQRDKVLLGMKAAYRVWLLAGALDPGPELH